MSKEVLDKIHKRVFDNFEYITDEKQYGQLEKWVVPEDVDNVKGDCEDFVLACRKLVRAEGLQSRIVFCKDETGAGHAVLESGGYVLDNRQRKVYTKQRLESKGYTFISISGFEPGDPWHKL